MEGSRLTLLLSLTITMISNSLEISNGHPSTREYSFIPWAENKTKINLLCYCSNTGVSFGVFLELCFSLPITMFKPVLRCQFQVLSLSLISKRTEKKKKKRINNKFMLLILNERGSKLFMFCWKCSKRPKPNPSHLHSSLPSIIHCND